MYILNNYILTSPISTGDRVTGTELVPSYQKIIIPGNTNMANITRSGKTSVVQDYDS